MSTIECPAWATLVLDDTQTVKKGVKSVGVAPQHCGLTGQVENCQCMVMLTYASVHGHAFIDRELYLPESWTSDRQRCRDAGVPADRGLVTKPHLGVTMLADHELRLCSLNVNSPDPARAQRLVGWLLDSGCNALVLTEMQPGQGGELIRTSLDAQGYQVSRTPGWRDNRFHTLVATKGFQVTPVEPGGFDPRVVAVDLTGAAGTIRLVGVYGPTNGMTPHSSGRRRVFQQQFLAYLGTLQRPGLCVTGDLNVVEPDHRPPLPAFEEHDYACYRGLLALGLRDAYRACHPQGGDHSWYSPRYGSQRLDHAMVGQTGTLRSCVYEHSPRHQEPTDHAALRLVLDLPS